MSESTATPFQTRCEILADLWQNYRQDDEFADFVEYNDLGLPLSYAIANEIVKPTEIAEQFVNETFELLLAGLEVDDDDYQDLPDLFAGTPEDSPPE
jgi:hypothetical protein